MSAEIEFDESKLPIIKEKFFKEVGKLIYGNEEAMELIFISLLCSGHTLLHGLPGLGKTKMASTISRALDMSFCRIQFTPDLMPSDITGTDIINEDSDTGRREREFLQGPVFSNLVLADEINRTPPKTQAALLQAMQEHEVSVGRKTYKLEEPFMVLATQNPIELEGTYILPEAQLDRFMFSVKMFYPSVEVEAQIVKGTTGVSEEIIETVMNKEDVIDLQKKIREVPISDDVILYAVRLVQETRGEATSNARVKEYGSYGASPRASQSLILGAKAKALLSGRCYVNFEDVKSIAKPVLRHRLVLNFRSKADGVDSDMLIDEIINSTLAE